MDRIWRALLSVLYPKRMKCCICGREAAEAVCQACLAQLEYIEGRVCLKCGKALEDEYEDNLCPDCRMTNRHYDMAVSCFQYRDTGKAIIHKLKYESCLEVTATLARLMHQKLRDEGLKIDAIVPIPIHKNKEQARGFNQAKLLAMDLAAVTGIPVWCCIDRIKETKEQYRLDRVHRMMNVHNAFCMNLLYNDVKYDSVLLLDDVYTTGSTVDECSRLLKQHGIKKVYVITAATGSNT